jgi:hypothetical protein
MPRRKQIATDWFGCFMMHVNMALITLLIALNKHFKQELHNARICIWGKTGIRLNMSLDAGKKISSNRSIAVDMIGNELYLK